MKKFKTLSILITIALIFGTVATAAPTSTPVSPWDGNMPLPLTSLSLDQVKNGALTVKTFLVGTTTLANFTSSGKLGIFGNGTVDSTASLDVGGPIRLSALNDQNRQVCANQSGDIALCNGAEFVYTYNRNCSYSGSTYSCTTVSGDRSFSYDAFKVPAGITSITVETWGSGGAGYGMNSLDNSPDTYSGCFSGSDYACAHGGSTIFYDTNGTTELLHAYGGKGARSANTGATNSGNFGTATGGDVNKNGGNGGNGSTAPSSTTSSITCNGTPRPVTIAAIGGAGGYGGKSGDGTDTPRREGGPGALGLNTMTNTSACNGDKTPNYNSSTGKALGFWSDNAFEGVLGSGGAGAGGRGSETDNDILDQCSIVGGGKSCIGGAQGFGGGAGAGYAKKTITVTPGSTYKMKLTHGGAPYDAATNVSPCAYGFHGSICSGGSFSGEGAPGFVKITY